MVGSGGNPGPSVGKSATEESGDQEPIPKKRMKIEAAAAELVGGSTTIDAPLIRPRYPPFPRPPYGQPAWESRISKLPKNDPRRKLPTVVGPVDPQTASCVRSSRDNAVVRDAARSTVSVAIISLDTDDDREIMNCFTGIVVGMNKTKKSTRILTASKFICGCDPKPKLQVRLPNKSVLEGQLLFFNEHYDIALLEILSESDLLLQVPTFGSNPNYGQEVFVLARGIDSYLMARHGTIKFLEESDYLGRNYHNEHYDIALLEILSESDLLLQVPTFGSNPNYGQEVFVLARGIDSYLMARHGTIKFLEESDYLGRNYHMFLSCATPSVGGGGPVVDLDGNVIGMVVEHYMSKPHPILPISTILTCMEMWMKFSRIAHPIHGLRLRTVDLLHVSLEDVLFFDHNINSGYIVDEVSVGSAAERLGIRSGEVIISFDGLRDHTLPQLEDFLLSLGCRFLQSIDLSSTIAVKLEVYDLLERRARTITLPVVFCDASEMGEEEESDESESEEEEEE